MNIFKNVVDVILSGERFLVASHAHPDGDGIGSTLAIAKGIESLGKKAVAFNADPVPYNLKFLPYSAEVTSRAGPLKDYDALILVDCSSRERVGGEVKDAVRGDFKKIVLIDHHKITSSECDLLCIDEEAAATGEVVLKILKVAGVKMTKEIATLLFCTFVVDSGSFRYSNTSAALLKDASELVDAGASPWDISKNLDESNPVSLIRLLPMVLNTFEMKGKVAWLTLSQQMLSDSGATSDVAEEFINYPRSINGVEVAVLFRQLKNDKWKVSFRSKEYIDVYQIAAKFNGGGHAHAAGCTLEGSLASVKEKILSVVHQFVG